MIKLSNNGLWQYRKKKKKNFLIVSIVIISLLAGGSIFFLAKSASTNLVSEKPNNKDKNDKPNNPKNPTPKPPSDKPDFPNPDRQPDSNDEGWLSYDSTKINDNTFKYRITLDGSEINYSDFIVLLKDKNKGFFELFQGALKDASSKFPGFFWKCPPVSKKTLNKPFEFVVIKSELLNNITQDYRDFDDYLAKIHGKDKPSCISFPNNRKPSDAILSIPALKVKNGKVFDYKNISQFTKNAPDEQQQKFWQEVAEKLSEELEKNDTPRWLNTHGLGVHYLHVRIDEKPKYYGDYEEYKKWE